MKAIMNSLSVCRLCLMPDKEGHFSTIFALRTTYNVVELLGKIANLEVTENDGLPQLICNLCLTEVESMYDFIVKCQQSFLALKNGNILLEKEEAFDEHIEQLYEPTEAETEENTKNSYPSDTHELVHSAISQNDPSGDITVTDPLSKVARQREVNCTQCCGCIEHFACYRELESHSRNCHLPDRAICGPLPEKQVECRICYKVFSSIHYLDTLHRLDAFKDRLQTFDNQEAIQCCSCETICSNLSELSAHAQQIHLIDRVLSDPVRPHECCYCFKRYTRKQALSYHQKYSFTYKKLLVTKRRGCRVIRRRMETEAASELRKCCGCFAEFRTEEALHQHSQMHHKLYRLQVEPSGDAKDRKHSTSHGCDICFKQFPSPLKLELHKSIPYSRTNRCPNCPKEFIKHALLENHLRKVHQIAVQNTNPGVTREPLSSFQCEECGLICASRSLLASHRMMHSEHKPFMCPLCNERFKRKQNLQSHLRKHTGERPFRCRYCVKVFCADADKNRHEMAYHTHQFKLRCDSCGMGFLRKRTFEQHRKKIHANE